MKNFYLDYNSFTNQYILSEGQTFEQRRETSRFKADNCLSLLKILKEKLDSKRKSKLSLYGEFDLDCAEKIFFYFSTNTKTSVNLDYLED